MKRSLAVVLCCLAFALAACGGNDAPVEPIVPETAIATPTSFGASPAAIPVSAATPIRVTRDGELVGDGVCQARVPLAWNEDAPGTGTTGGGHAFSIFGNNLTGDDTWDTAITLLKRQATLQPGADLIEGETFVRITYPNATGLAYRARFDGVYCDIRITGRGSPISEGERATWDGIIASLEPVR